MHITSAQGWDAVYRHSSEDGSPVYWDHKPVAVWRADTDGEVEGLVVESGRLCGAESMRNFSHYAPSVPEMAPVTVAPEPGWFVVERIANELDLAWWAPVLAWAVSEDGWIVGAITAHEEPAEPVFAADEQVTFVHAPERARVSVVDVWPDKREGSAISPNEPLAPRARDAQDAG